MLDGSNDQQPLTFARLTKIDAFPPANASKHVTTGFVQEVLVRRSFSMERIAADDLLRLQGSK